MEFEWDENKNQSNYRKHGILFQEAIEIFNNECFSWIDDRRDYGEIREITIGEIDNNIVLIVVHTDRLGKRRIISARKANSRERRKYYEYK